MTEILAQQHFNSIQELLENTEIKVRLLTVHPKVRKEKIIHEELEKWRIVYPDWNARTFEDKVKFQTSV